MHPVFFDHIEVHVDDIDKYCFFLETLFQGGRSKVISPSGTSMFKSNDGVNIEVKKRKVEQAPSPSGFCRPCLRMMNARTMILDTLGYEIESTIQNEDGNVYFFTDYEGITWHIKEHLIVDKFCNW